MGLHNYPGRLLHACVLLSANRDGLTRIDKQIGQEADCFVSATSIFPEGCRVRSTVPVGVPPLLIIKTSS